MNNKEKLNINKDFLEKICSSLENMTNYADDGVISRFDSDFKEFFDCVDEAREIINKINEVLGE